MDAVAIIGILMIVTIVLVVYVTLYQNKAKIGSKKVVIVKEHPYGRFGPYGGPYGYHG